MTRSQDFDTFFTTHYGPMVRTLTLIGGDREAAADSVQDAFVRAHARWRRVSRYDAPAAWVRKVAINRLRDMKRSETRRQRREDRVAGAPSSSPSDPVTLDADLLSTVGSLPEQQKTAIALHYLEDLSVDEVAHIMGLSSGAVKYHLHEGRKKLEPQLRTARFGGDDD